MAVAGVFVLAAPAQSATQGTLGATSSGTAAVSVVLPSRVKITGLADLAIGTYVGPTSSASGNVCIYSNTDGYNITVTSAEGLFQMDGVTTPGDKVTYAVEWAATSGAGTGSALTYNTALTGQTTPAAGNVTCGGGTNATLIVRVADADIGAGISAQTYAGTLTLVVAPE